jgi:hypothetical protein
LSELLHFSMEVDLTHLINDNLMTTIPLFLLSMELRLFPFQLIFMCLNGVVVEVKWKNPFFINGDLN